MPLHLPIWISQGLKGKKRGYLRRSLTALLIVSGYFLKPFTRGGCFLKKLIDYSFLGIVFDWNEWFSDQTVLSITFQRFVNFVFGWVFCKLEQLDFGWTLGSCAADSCNLFVLFRVRCLPLMFSQSSLLEFIGGIHWMHSEISWGFSVAREVLFRALKKLIFFLSVFAFRWFFVGKLALILPHHLEFYYFDWLNLNKPKIIIIFKLMGGKGKGKIIQAGSKTGKIVAE